MKEKESGTKYQETKQHGSRLFPFNIYPCSIPVDFSHVAKQKALRENREIFL